MEQLLGVGSHPVDLVVKWVGSIWRVTMQLHKGKEKHMVNISEKRRGWHIVIGLTSLFHDTKRFRKSTFFENWAGLSSLRSYRRLD